MELSQFIHELIQEINHQGVEVNLVNCRFLDSLGRPLVWEYSLAADDRFIIIETPTPQEADRLWEMHRDIRRIATPYGWQKIEIRGLPLIFDVVIKQKYMENIIESSDLSTREKYLLIEAIASDRSFAVVRLRDNCVIQAGSGILKTSTAPAGLWPGYDITSLWVPQDISWADYQAGIGERSTDLDRIYSLLEYGPGNTGQQIQDIEYVAYRSKQENGKIVRGDRAHFVSDIYRLNDYFGEPCRLCMAKESYIF